LEFADISINEIPFQVLILTLFQGKHNLLKNGALKISYTFRQVMLFPPLILIREIFSLWGFVK
jgi:hypothetical protein